MGLRAPVPGKSLLPSGAAGGTADRRLVKARFALAAAAVVAVLLWARYEHTLGLGGGLWGSAGGARLVAFKEAHTLQFDVCNGFTNQRIALMSGLVLAAELKRAVVLPDWLLNGFQADGKDQVTAANSSTVPFRDWFEEAAFAEALASAGLGVVAGRPPKATAVSVKDFSSLAGVDHLVKSLKKKRSKQHIRLDCPAFRLPGALMKRHRALLTAAAGGLRPSERFQSVIAARRAQIEAGAGASAYNLLHLRVERDWLGLCEWWQKPAEGRDNCMNNTDTVGEQLQRHGFETEVPLVVATSFPDAVPDVLGTALDSIRGSKYRSIVLGSELAGAGDGAELSREEGALVDYYLALEAGRFIGNSVSTFSAFVILERQWQDRFSAHYNGGSIPLATYFPLYASKQSS